jgi:type I restriction enzyme M protein
MLDSETKRRIDTARDILVGKVPDPKSQVEQITIALIYKFMDDMDAQAEELGGKRKFFAGDFAKYGWAKLMAPSVSGEERINLYGESIVRMPQNPGIPKLFRDIFKNAFLPYRDPETLNLFLKTINEFEYDHSERLGDAFEYLLSVLGSQGEAGQFRTPRHIIDFIVAIVDPKKTETVLDPACGTAGFLISAYKHILRANSTPQAIEKSTANGDAILHTSKIPLARGDLLAPDERKKLADNFRGYDISPDMVRLSLVNMYLHGFTDPHVHEYDTLTSQDRWNEMADVILANPPFMSPKGGIKPHNRFSIQAKRSEVLFVDYMAEHLVPAGRAGFIVPEGIIFQSQTAYKALRKMLVEQYLVAVVSLPAGVFNPYSGVKTAILILDKPLAKESDTVGFFKVENDGFNLGAQRRPIDKNDLPQVLAEVNEYLRRLRAKQAVTVEDFTLRCGLIVAKEKIAANGDYNVSGERYREGAERTNRWPQAPLATVVDIESGSRQKGGAVDSGVPSIGGEQIDDEGRIRFDKMKYVTEEHFRQMPKGKLRHGDVLMVKDGATTGKTGFFVHDDLAAVNEHVFILRAKERIDPYFLYRVVRAPDFQERLQPYIKGIIGGISLEIQGLEIPLPPLEMQKEIVAEIEAYQKVIDGARAVLDHYRPYIPIHPDWPVVPVGDVIDGPPKNGYSGKPVQHETHLRVLSLSATTSGQMDLTQFKYLDEHLPPDAECRCRKGDIYLQRGNTRELVGTSALFDSDAEGFIYPDLMIRVRANEEKIQTRYLLLALKSKEARDFMSRNASGSAGSMPKINQSIVEQIPIPLAPPETQRAIVAAIEAEQRLVEGNRELVERMDMKIANTLVRNWGEEPAGAAAADGASGGEG